MRLRKRGGSRLRRLKWDGRKEEIKDFKRVGGRENGSLRSQSVMVLWIHVIS